jgi:hypothetical protein
MTWSWAKPEWPRLQLALFAAALCSSCVSILSRNQIISVDSEPRGATVFDASNYPLGTTPLFLQIPRASTFTLRIGDQRKKAAETQTRNCTYRWIESGILNVPIVGQALDLASGAAYECPYYWRFHASGPEIQKRDSCQNWVILGPDLPNRTLQKIMAQRWLKEAKQHLGGRCINQVDELSMQTAFDRYGSVDRSFLQWEPRRQLLLASGTRAQVVAEIKLEQLPDGTSILKGNVIDVHSQAVKAIDVPVKLTQDDADAAGAWWHWHELAALVPNSFAAALGNSTLLLSNENPAARYENQSPTGLTVTLANVSHPELHGIWDLDTSLDTNFSFNSFGTKFLKAPSSKSNNETNSSQIASEINARALSLSAFFGGQITGHTPLGALGISAGIGPLFLKVSGSDIRSFYTISPALEIALHYTAFLSDRVFTGAVIEVQSLLDRGNKVADDITIQGLGTTKLVLGIWLPEARNGLRNWAR